MEWPIISLIVPDCKLLTRGKEGTWLTKLTLTAILLYCLLIYSKMREIHLRKGLLLSSCLMLILLGQCCMNIEALTASSQPLNPSGRRPRIPTTPDRRWEIRPIGKVESIYKEKFGTPKQATIGSKESGKLHLFEEFNECLEDLDGFNYIWVLTLMHLNDGYKTRIKPLPRQNEDNVPEEVGLFSCRAPHRPNPIAMSACEVISVDLERGVVEVNGMDLLDDTPILDIKPYVPAFDAFPNAKAGWMDNIFDPLVARERGYQDIKSSRGRRQANKEKRH